MILDNKVSQKLEFIGNPGNIYNTQIFLQNMPIYIIIQL